MATYLENLKTRRDAIATYLASLTCGSGADSPTTAGEGVNPQDQQKIDSYTKQLAELQKLIDEEEGRVAAAGGNVGIFETRVIP